MSTTFYNLKKPTNAGQVYPSKIMSNLISVETTPGIFRWLPKPSFVGERRSLDGYNYISVGIPPNITWKKYIVTPNPQIPILTEDDPGFYGQPGLIDSLVAAAEASVPKPKPKPSLSAAAAEYIPMALRSSTSAASGSSTSAASSKPSIKYTVKYGNPNILKKEGTTFVPLKVLPLPNGYKKSNKTLNGGRRRLRRNKTKRNRITNKK